MLLKQHFEKQYLANTALQALAQHFLVFKYLENYCVTFLKGREQDTQLTNTNMQVIIIKCVSTVGNVL